MSNPKDKNLKLLKVHSEEIKFTGPLPHPDVLAKYEGTLPGTAERLLRLAEKEKEQEHRINIDKALIKHGDEYCSQYKRGQQFALIAIFFVIMVFTLGSAHLHPQ